MANGHGRRRRRGGAPRVPERVREGAPVRAQGEEAAARRARLAAVIESLRRLCAPPECVRRLLRSIFARAEAPEALPTAEETPQGGGQSKVRQAAMYGNKKLQPRHPQEPRRAPSPPPSPLLMIRGESVSKLLEMQYKEYCKNWARVADSSCYCHMCFFEMPSHDHMTILKSEMLKHCWDKHGTGGQMCKVPKCEVRVRTKPDGDLHMHFCHPRVAF